MARLLLTVIIIEPDTTYSLTVSFKTLCLQFVHCHPMTNSHPSTQEYTPLLGENSNTMNAKQRGATLFSIASQAGVILFAILVWSVLLTTPWSLFSYHPAGMSILVVAVTEGI